MTTSTSNQFRLNVIAASTGSPTWYSSTTTGQWVSIPSANGTLLASGQTETTAGKSWPSGSNRVQAVVASWNSGCIATTGVYSGATFIPGPHIILFGGGHADWDGNEVYAFGPLTSSTPQWRRLRNATVSVQADVPYQSDNTPTQRHTWDATIYHPSRNQMVLVGAASWVGNGSGRGPQVDAFNFGTVSPNSNFPWTRYTSIPAGVFNSIYTVNPFTVYDSVADTAVYVPFESIKGVGVFSFASNSWTTYSRTGVGIDTAGNHTSAYSPSLRLMCFYRGGSTVHFMRTDTGIGSIWSPPTTGTGPSGGTGGVLWDPINNRFVFWTGLEANRRTLHYLTAPASSPYQGGNAWTWSSTTPGAGATPGPHTGLGSGDYTGYTTGIYKRFEWCDNPRGYVLTLRVDEQPYLFKV